jgi:hypothetical protein
MFIRAGARILMLFYGNMYGKEPMTYKVHGINQECNHFKNFIICRNYHIEKVESGKTPKNYFNFDQAQGPVQTGYEPSTLQPA